jgi:hypothetical protein
MREFLTVEGFKGSLKELAVEISNMRYDSIAKLFSYILLELERKSARDQMFGKTKLSDAVNKSCMHINRAILYVQEASDICEPFIDGKDNKEVEKRL